MSNPIALELNDEIMLVKFIRPDIRNPISLEVLDELGRVLHQAGKDGTIRKIVFTGTADTFASGADLREILAVNGGAARDFARRGQGVMWQVENLRIPAVAAINGYCFGGGLDLAIACRHRIASPDATFCHPGARLGIITGWGGTQRLPRLVGEANALEMLFTASPISAKDALRIGLVDRIANDPVAEALSS